MSTANYQGKIRQEGHFWGARVKDNLCHGIPYLVDFRRGEKLHPLPHHGHLEDDPKLFEMVMGKEYHQMLDEILVHSEEHKTVLDLGCGPGGLSLEIARNDRQVVGMDISSASLKIARHFLNTNPFKTHFGSLLYVRADLNTYIFPKGKKYDVVCANGLFHHIVSMDHLLTQISQVLGPHGYLVCYDNIGETNITKFIKRVIHLYQRRKPNYLSPISRGSPFEGVGQESFLPAIKKYFTRVEVFRCQAFVKIIVHHLYRLDLPTGPLYLLTRILKFFDRILCASGLSRGENVLVVARNST